MIGSGFQAVAICQANTVDGAHTVVLYGNDPRHAVPVIDDKSDAIARNDVSNRHRTEGSGYQRPIGKAGMRLWMLVGRLRCSKLAGLVIDVEVPLARAV